MLPTHERNHLTSGQRTSKTTEFSQIGTATTAMFTLFMVLLTVFIMISEDLEDAGSPSTAPADQGLQAESLPIPENPSLSEPAPMAGQSMNVGDFETGFTTHLPADWKRVETRTMEIPVEGASQNWAFESPSTGARIAIGTWRSQGLAPLSIWALEASNGMRSVDGEWPQNANIAGRPALVLWSPAQAGAPARYAAFLESDESYICIAYTAYDGGQAMPTFMQALAGFELPEPGAYAAQQWTNSVDLLPVLPEANSSSHP